MYPPTEHTRSPALVQSAEQELAWCTRPELEVQHRLQRRARCVRSQSLFHHAAKDCKRWCDALNRQRRCSAHSNTRCSEFDRKCWCSVGCRELARRTRLQLGRQAQGRRARLACTVASVALCSTTSAGATCAMALCVMCSSTSTGAANTAGTAAM